MKKIILCLVVAVLSLHSAVAFTVPDALYMRGAVMGDNWLVGHLMDKDVAGEVTTFTWTGILVPGAFRFVTDPTGWGGYNLSPATMNEPALISTSQELSEAALQFDLATGLGGAYVVTVTMTTASATMLIEPAPIYVPTEIWATGSALSGGGSVKLSQLPDGKFLYGGQLQVGELKFMDTETAGAGTHYIVPATGTPNIISTSDLQITDDGSIAGWNVSAAATCQVKVSFSANSVIGTTFTPPANLYIIGGCTPGLWDPAIATPLVKDVEDANVFIFDGDLVYTSGQDNNFRFLTQLGWGPGFGTNSMGEPLLGSQYVIPNMDVNWSIDESQQGHYIIRVNTLLETIESEFIAPDVVLTDLWITGTALSGNIVKLSGRPNSTFFYGGELQTGEVKFIDTETIDSTTHYIVPATAGDIVGESQFTITTNAALSGWTVANASTSYKVKVNALSKNVNASIYAPPSQLYIVGGCTPGDWNPANALPLVQDTEDANVFVFDGELIYVPGTADQGFRFLAQLGWGAGFGANSDGEPLLGSQYAIPGAAYNWTINASQQGRYIIKVNTLLETIDAQFAVFTVPVGGKSAALYTIGDIIFESDEAGAGQLTDIQAGGLPVVNGVVKYVRTFTPGKWYTIGFPFAVTATANLGAGVETLVSHNGLTEEASWGDFWLKTIKEDASGFIAATGLTTLAAGQGYIIQFPSAFAGKPVTFTSVNLVTLAATPVELIPASTHTGGYALAINPGVSNIITHSTTFIGHYEHSADGKTFLPKYSTTISSKSGDNTGLRPFEALLVAHSSDVPSLRSTISTDDGTTNLDTINANDPVIATTYYNLQGQSVGAAIYRAQTTGVYIVKQIHESGKTTVTKQIK
jgi:hypothetical protein